MHKYELQDSFFFFFKTIKLIFLLLPIVAFLSCSTLEKNETFDSDIQNIESDDESFRDTDTQDIDIVEEKDTHKTIDADIINAPDNNSLTADTEDITDIDKNIIVDNSTSTPDIDTFECSNGQTETKACGPANKGEKTRICVAGVWGNVWTECFLSGDTCSSAIDIKFDASDQYSDNGTTDGFKDEYQTSNQCGLYSEHQDVVYKIVLDEKSTLDIILDAKFDSVLYVSSNCTHLNVCTDNFIAGKEQGYRQIKKNLDAGTYFIFVDGYGIGNYAPYDDSHGEYSLSINKVATFDPCKNFDCSGHGTCTVDSDNNPKCNCYTLYDGDSCGECADKESYHLEGDICVINECIAGEIEVGDSCGSNTTSFEKKTCKNGQWSESAECVDICENISCSDKGLCDVDENKKAICDCENGYHASGLECIEDGTVDIPVNGLSISEVAIYQSVKIPLMKNGSSSSSTIPVIAGKKALIRIFVKTETSWSNRSIRAVISFKASSAALPPLSQKKVITSDSNELILDSTFCRINCCFL